MAWDFETDPEFSEKLEWMDAFVKEHVEPLVFLGFHPYDVKNPLRNKHVRPLQEEVKKQGFGPVIWGLDSAVRGMGK